MKRIQAGEVRGLLIQQFRTDQARNIIARTGANRRPSTIAQ
jgi:hypothetical protein